MSDSVGDDTLLSTPNLELLKAYKEEENFWRQRSRLMWLAAGDRNSGYFHVVCKGKRARNRITVLENAYGLALNEESLIFRQFSHQVTHQTHCLNQHQFWNKCFLHVSRLRRTSV